MIYTSLARVKGCVLLGDWGTLLAHLNKTEADEAPLAYSIVLEALGFAGTLRCLKAEPQHAKLWRLFALRCARKVQHRMGDVRSLHALDVAERHVRGEANGEELAAAWRAAGDVWSSKPPNGDAWDAAWAAVAADADAAEAAKNAAWRAAGYLADDAATAAAGRAAKRTPTDFFNAFSALADDLRALLASHEAMPGERVSA